MLISGINNLGNVTLLRDGERLEGSGDRGWSTLKGKASKSRQKNSPHSSSLGRKAGAAFAKAPYWQFRSHLATVT